MAEMRTIRLSEAAVPRVDGGGRGATRGSAVPGARGSAVNGLGRRPGHSERGRREADRGHRWWLRLAWRALRRVRRRVGGIERAGGSMRRWGREEGAQHERPMREKVSEVQLICFPRRRRHIVGGHARGAGRARDGAPCLGRRLGLQPRRGGSPSARSEHAEHGRGRGAVLSAPERALDALC